MSRIGCPLPSTPLKCSPSRGQARCDPSGPRLGLLWVVVGVGLLTASWTLPGSAQTPPDPLTASQVADASGLLQAFRSDARGPYLRIRWVCQDGSTHAPGNNPCAERGGGYQYAELKPEARALHALGLHVGTNLRAYPNSELIDAGRGGFWLRELVVQRYLEQTDDGWIYRRARYYRGARQIEDEEARGTELLVQLLADTAWTRSRYLLGTRLVGVLPHQGADTQGGTDRIRNLATEIAAADSRFFDTRVKIHSFPSAEDLGSVQTFLARSDLVADVRSKAVELRDALARQYDSAQTVRRIAAAGARLPRELRNLYVPLETGLGAGDPAIAIPAIAEFLVASRLRIESSSDGRGNLRLLDLSALLQQRAFVLGQTEPTLPSRRAALMRTRHWIDIAYGSGFLSQRERGALHGELDTLTNGADPSALEYRNALGYVARGIDWSWGAARATFGPVVTHYAPVEPRVSGFLDALVRASVLLPLSGHVEELVADANSQLGASHRVLGATVSQGVRGLNPGLALRPLHLAITEEQLEHVSRDGIYAIPSTTPELKPVAGVLTLDEGNLLSHVQLLARNLGIPNAVVPSTLLEALRQAEGDTVLFAVSPLGRVVLERPSQLEPDERRLIAAAQAPDPPRLELDTSRLDLTRSSPISLHGLRASASGVVVGPKAANLGELAYIFPDRVSAGVAVPFGMFVRHVDRPYAGSRRTVLAELRAAYDSARAMKVQGRSEAEIDTMMFDRLQWVRSAIEGLPWIQESRKAVADSVLSIIGDPAQGVFIRSDTNVEDLPQFSGAGLNLTVPHRRSMDEILASVKRVWTSPFSERAYLWRKQILEQQADVYPSVLLLVSVPSEKSGVLITSGLQEGGPDDLTIVTAEGVGGGVEGEEAETVVVRPTASGAPPTVRLLSTAKAPRRRVLNNEGSGGVAWRVARLPQVLLGDADLAQLEGVVNEWRSRVPEADRDEVWDMEFGFTNGKLWLFQVRPFVRFKNSGILNELAVLDRGLAASADVSVALDGPLSGAGR